VFAERGLRDAQFFCNQHRADAILYEISVDLWAKVCFGVFKPLKDLKAAVVRKGLKYLQSFHIVILLTNDVNVKGKEPLDCPTSSTYQEKALRNRRHGIWAAPDGTFQSAPMGRMPVRQVCPAAFCVTQIPSRPGVEVDLVAEIQQSMPPGVPRQAELKSLLVKCSEKFRPNDYQR
jgi:hypothetical protein